MSHLQVPDPVSSALIKTARVFKNPFAPSVYGDRDVAAERDSPAGDKIVGPAVDSLAPQRIFWSRSKIKRLFLWIVLSSSSSPAQTSHGVAGLIERVDDKEFRDCTRLQAIALDAQHRIPSYAYNLALIPKNSRTAFFTFPSDVSTAVPINWLSRYHPEKSAFASLYSVGSSYTFHCRDDQGRLTKSSGPEGDPLQLTLASGLAEIWHFSVFGKGMATVMVVTDVPLDRLEGQDLLDEATRRLRARIVLLYVRNDPWFFGYASDSLPYVFTDGYRRISEAEYRATRTMVCESHEGCKVVPSLYQ